MPIRGKIRMVSNELSELIDLLESDYSDLTVEKVMHYIESKELLKNIKTIITNYQD